MGLDFRLKSCLHPFSSLTKREHFSLYGCFSDEQNTSILEESYDYSILQDRIPDLQDEIEDIQRLASSLRIKLADCNVDSTILDEVDHIEGLLEGFNDSLAATRFLFDK